MSLAGICHLNSTICDTILLRGTSRSRGKDLTMKQIKLAVAALIAVLATSSAVVAAPGDAGVVSANESHCC